MYYRLLLVRGHVDGIDNYMYYFEHSTLLRAHHCAREKSEPSPSPSYILVVRKIVVHSVGVTKNRVIKMNVIAKSANIAPFARASATVVSNGTRPVAGTSKTMKPKVQIPPTVKRTLGWTLSQDISRGPIRISSGPAGSCYKFTS